MTTLKKGSRGDEVKTLQRMLGITDDGIFGVNTETEVKKYQLSNGLVMDGIVGNKTWDMLKKKCPGIYIEEYHLNIGQYLSGKYMNDYIFLHHTAGSDNPYNVVSGWNSDTQGKVATEFVVGGQNCTTGKNTYDGKIIRTFPEGCSGYHIGTTGSSYMNTHSVGIEMCNMGWLDKNGKTYVKSKCIETQKIHLDKPYREYSDWHKYSDVQLESVRKLLLYISKRDNIDLHEGLYKWIKQKGVLAFDFNQDAYYGRVKGLLHHGNVRKDKYDCSPQPELIDMILSL